MRSRRHACGRSIDDLETEARNAQGEER
jgi:hypothetical protein